MIIRRVLVTCIALTLAVLLAACAGDDAADTVEVAPESPDAPEPEEATEPEEPEEPAAGATTVAVADSDDGQHLADDEGNTLYLFDPDTDGVSTCYDDCAANWPPLITDGDAQAAEGLDQALLGTAERDDGQVQVTYNDWPLYYFSNDQESGDTNGQGVNDVWWLVSPEGTAIRDDAEAPEEEATEEDTSSSMDGY
ncbi:MAG: hypothetical protein GEU81_15865 [Nitriliruptorales bacterium]|nr:hypothetical protein [Nitriliruptorales bacterium]